MNAYPIIYESLEHYSSLVLITFSYIINQTFLVVDKSGYLHFFMVYPNKKESKTIMILGSGRLTYSTGDDYNRQIDKVSESASNTDGSDKDDICNSFTTAVSTHRVVIMEALGPSFD